MKNKTLYRCESCDTEFSKWAGRCDRCGEWNSLVEQTIAPKKGKALSAASTPVPVTQIPKQDLDRCSTGLAELNRVLGGGLVPGSAILIGGEPGVGKSTLLLQCANSLTESVGNVLYVSGEESITQLGMRAERLGIKDNNLLVMSETNLDSIFEQVDKMKPKAIILDSIQTLWDPSVGSAPGTVSQVREATQKVISYCKATSMAGFIVGHVTKEGSIAGPKHLEHMVDTVLYFEGSASRQFRILRSIKNRFGATNEVGVFEMTSLGVKEVANPSAYFLAERRTDIPGSVITCSIEGTRPILIEVQALVSPTALGMARRTSIGYDPNRLSLLIAILEKRGGYRFADQDVYINIAGGIKLTEPGADLAVAAALMSSHSGQTVAPETLFFGEVGLGGEIRSVPQTTERVREASRLGLTQIFLASQKSELDTHGVELKPLENIQQLVDFV